MTKEELEKLFEKHHEGFGYYNKNEIIKELLILLNQNEMGKSEIARKIVEYFNQDEMCMGKWDSIMYEQKRVVMNLLDQLNQNKDE
jgi:hypothetical protein